MAINTIGQLEQFKPGTDDWEQYQERHAQYFVANGIEGEEKKRVVLLTVVGPQAYLLLSNLVAPTKPAEKTYAALTKAMLDHLKPKPLIIAERFQFHRRNQTEGEGISQRRTEEASRLL